MSLICKIREKERKNKIKKSTIFYLFIFFNFAKWGHYFWRTLRILEEHFPKSDRKKSEMSVTTSSVNQFRHLQWAAVLKSYQPEMTIVMSPAPKVVLHRSPSCIENNFFQLKIHELNYGRNILGLSRLDYKIRVADLASWGVFLCKEVPHWTLHVYDRVE